MSKDKPDIVKEIESLTRSKEKSSEETVIDDVFSQTPMELRKVADNLSFIEKIRKKLPKRKEYAVTIFGAEKVSLESIFMMNIWDRSILTYDAVSRLVLKMTLEQLRKYIPKKTKKQFDYWWLILLITIGVGGVMFIILFLLPRLAGIKLF